MRINVNNATSRQLNWLVTRCLHPKADMSSTYDWLDTGDGEEDFLIEDFTGDWAKGGAIIGCERLEFRKARKGMFASYHKGKTYLGDTHLIAAMRCYVARCSGEQVDVPEALC